MDLISWLNANVTPFTPHSGSSTSHPRWLRSLGKRMTLGFNHFLRSPSAVGRNKNKRIWYSATNKGKAARFYSQSPVPHSLELSCPFIRFHLGCAKCSRSSSYSQHSATRRLLEGALNVPVCRKVLASPFLAILSFSNRLTTQQNWKHYRAGRWWSVHVCNG